MTSEAPQDVAALRKLAEKATPGPWRWVMDSGSVMLWNSEPVGGPGHILTPHVCETCANRGAPCLGPNDADAAYIAAFSPDVSLGLLDREAQVVAMLDYWLASLDVYDGIDWKAEFTAARDLLRGSGAEEAARNG